MKKEIAIAHAAPSKAKEELERIRKSGSAPGAAPTAAPAAAASPAAATAAAAPSRVKQNGHTYERQPDGSYRPVD